MPKKSDLDNALDGEPWSFGGVVFGLDELLDDEGRPISERRAPSKVKEGVSIELRSCPYGDERKGQQMNVSALEQLKRHFDGVLEELAAFRAAGPPEGPDWAEVFAAVTDQLAAPARFLLASREREGPVPARIAVGHKLAAGYFGVLRKLLLGEARGERRGVSAANLLGFVREQRALIGASEVCAGPPKMIAHVTNVLVSNCLNAKLTLPGDRVSLARWFSYQVRVGIEWELFDLESERRFLLEEIGRERMRARNGFLERKLDRRIEELDQKPCGAPGGVPVPVAPVAALRGAVDRLRTVLAKPERTPEFRRDADAIRELLAHREGAIEIDLAEAEGVVAASFARYLTVYRTFLRVQREVETELRKLLGFDVTAPIRFHTSVLPKPKALEWYEVVVGHNLERAPSPESDWVLRNHRRTVSLRGEGGRCSP